MTMFQLTKQPLNRETPRFTPERIEVLQVLSKKPDVYERLARAIAPSIYENEDIKKGILLQLFGGTRKDFTEAGRGHFRWVVGDLGLMLFVASDDCDELHITAMVR